MEMTSIPMGGGKILIEKTRRKISFLDYVTLVRKSLPSAPIQMCGIEKERERQIECLYNSYTPSIELNKKENYYSHSLFVFFAERFSRSSFKRIKQLNEYAPTESRSRLLPSKKVIKGKTAVTILENWKNWCILEKRNS